MLVSCECYVSSGRGLCDELISRPKESYRMRCVVLCDLETSEEAVSLEGPQRHTKIIMMIIRRLVPSLCVRLVPSMYV